MRRHFEEELPHQLAAIQPVCDLFRGQEVCRTEFAVTRRTASQQMGLVLEHGMDVACHAELAPASDVTCVFRDSDFANVAKSNLAAILEQRGLANVRSL